MLKPCYGPLFQIAMIKIGYGYENNGVTPYEKHRVTNEAHWGTAMQNPITPQNMPYVNPVEQKEVL